MNGKRKRKRKRMIYFGNPTRKREMKLITVLFLAYASGYQSLPIANEITPNAAFPL